ncbi:MAG: peptidyl-prolyl cis-trans isomerase [Roseovarius sp.]
MAIKGVSNTLAWIILGLLVLGLGGFGVTNLSGGLRTIGSVGDVEIDVNDYARALQQEIRAIEAERGEALGFARAREMGIPEAVLARLVVTAALDDEARRIGLSVGDATLRDRIVAMRQFQGLDGSFDRESYRFALQQAGLSEGEFEEDVRADGARGVLQAAIMGGVRMPEGYSRALSEYLGERREITWAVLDRGDLATGLPVPGDADLRAYYEAHIARYTLPERKRITYALLTPEMLIDSAKPDEESLRQAYAARAEEFNRPERRLVERLAFPDEAAAAAARARIDAGEADFETLVRERGLDLADTDLGDVTREDLGKAGEAVFAAKVGDVVGPLPSSVGPALFRVNARLEAQHTSFEEARPALGEELALGRARQMIANRIDAIDDLLAGGGTIEDLARESGMKLGQIDWHEGMSDGIAGYEAFRKAAAALSADDYPRVMDLDDGGIFAMRLDETLPPAPRPFEEVREAVAEAWSGEKLVEELKAQIAPAIARLEGGASFADAGLVADGSATITRRSARADLPPALTERVFAMQPGEVAQIAGDGRLLVARLEAVLPPDPQDPDLQQLQTLLAAQAGSGLAQDLFQLVANDIRARAGIKIDQAAINAVHATFQ